MFLFCFLQSQTPRLLRVSSAVYLTLTTFSPPISLDPFRTYCAVRYRLGTSFMERAKLQKNHLCPHLPPHSHLTNYSEWFLFQHFHQTTLLVLFYFIPLFYNYMFFMMLVPLEAVGVHRLHNHRSHITSPSFIEIYLSSFLSSSFLLIMAEWRLDQTFVVLCCFVIKYFNL